MSGNDAFAMESICVLSPLSSNVEMPGGLLIAYSKFTGKRFVLTCLNTLLALVPCLWWGG